MSDPDPEATPDQTDALALLHGLVAPEDPLEAFMFGLKDNAFKADDRGPVTSGTLLADNTVNSNG